MNDAERRKVMNVLINRIAVAKNCSPQKLRVDLRYKFLALVKREDEIDGDEVEEPPLIGELWGDQLRTFAAHVQEMADGLGIRDERDGANK